MADTWRDIGHAARRLTKSPVLLLVTSLTLALGVAANSVIFSLVDAFYFRPPAVRAPEQLARLYTGEPKVPQDRTSYPDFEDLQSQIRAFAELIASGRRGALLRAGDEAELLMAEVVSRNYFDALGVAMARGRSWRPDEAEPEDEPLVVISHDLWQSRFGGDPDIAGRAIDLNGKKLAIGGVTPPEFRGLDRLIRVDVWISLDTWAARMGSAEELRRRGLRWLDVWGRLEGGQTARQAEAQCGVVAARLSWSYPETNADRNCSVVMEMEQRRRQGLPVSALLLSLAGLVLLVCCANVANLLLAQAEARQREIATRSALGASRLRIARQIALESLLLAAAGGGLGLVSAWWLLDLLPAAIPQTSVRLNLDFALNWRVVVFTATATILSAALFGTAPVMHASRLDLMSALRGGHVKGKRSRLTARNALVACQVAVCVTLLTASGLFLRNLTATSGIDPGFERKHMLLALVNPGLSGYDRQGSLALLDRLTGRLRGLPGVERASYAMRAPLSPMGGGSEVAVMFPSQRLEDEEVSVKYNAVGPEYFDTMGTRILSGRGFEPRDRQGSQPVVLVSETTARRFWNGGDPVGALLQTGETEWQVVGVVEDVKINRLREADEPYLYFPLAQRPRGELTLLLETAGPPLGLTDSVRGVFRETAPGVPILSLATQEQLVRLSVYEETLYARLASTLGLLGLLLASAGLFGVISYLVQRQTNEIGVRLAIGAPPRRILFSFVLAGLGLGLVGIVIGSVSSLALTGLLARFIHTVSPYDPPSFLGAAGLVLLVTACASYWPARGALRVDPARALRHD